MIKSAFFLENTPSIHNLKRPHLLDEERFYTIEKTIILPKIEYENFIEDFYVERWFIEEFENCCKIDDEGIWHCLLVQQKGEEDGVLVMSDGYEYPKWVAYINAV